MQPIHPIITVIFAIASFFTGMFVMTVAGHC
jgi:hypothetical protein